MKRYQITIKGSNVQRCGLRNNASGMARSLQLAGLAEYLNKGVFINVEGKTENINLFNQWCHIRPDGVMIENVEINELPVSRNSDFKVVPGVISTRVKENA